MYKLNRRGELSLETTGDLIEHGSRMTDGIVLELSSNLLVSDERSYHLDNGTPHAFGKAIR